MNCLASYARRFLPCLLLLALCGCGVLQAMEEKSGPQAKANGQKAPVKKAEKIPPAKPPEPKFKDYLRDRPYLRVRLPDNLQVNWGWPHEAGSLLWASQGPDGPRLLIQVRPEAGPLAWDQKAPETITAEKTRLAREMKAGNWAPVEPAAIGGLKGLRLMFTAQGVHYQRYLLPAPGWLYIVTLAYAAPPVPKWMIGALASLRLSPFTPDQATGLAPKAPDKDISGLIYSLCPVQIGRAKKRLAKGLQDNPQNPKLAAQEVEAAIWEAEALRLQGRSAPAVDWWPLRLAAKKAVNRSPKSPEAWRALGLSRYLDGKNRKAQEALKRALQRAPQDQATLLALALASEGDRQKELAIKAVEAAPHQAGARLFLASLYLREKRLELARSQYVAASKADPLNTTALLGLARFLMDEPAGQKQAARLLAQVIQLDPQNGPACFNLALLRLKEGQPEETERLLEPVLLRSPADAAALNLRGLALREQKKDQEAAQAFRQAVQADPKHAGAYYNLGALCASRLKDQACARQAFKAFLELEPASERAIRIRAWLTRQGF